MKTAMCRTFKPRGFSLVEMLVVLAIIVIVTSVALFGQSKFNQSLILSDTAYTVAFSLRQAQSLGLSSRLSSSQSIAYGLHFSTTGSPGLYSYILFADLSNQNAKPSSCNTGTSGTPEFKPGNCVYDYNDTTPPTDSAVQTFKFERLFYVDRFCGREASPGTTIRCANAANTDYLSRINIAFLRPNTDVVITGIERTIGTAVPLRNAAIYIKSPDGLAERGVCVSQVGQIFVATSTCPL